MSESWKSVLRGIPKEQLKEVEHITAESLGIRVEGKTVIHGAERLTYGEPAYAEGAAKHLVAVAQKQALIKLHGRCKETHWHGRAGSTRCDMPVVEHVPTVPGITTASGKEVGLCANHLRGYRLKVKNRAAKDQAASQAKASDAGAKERAAALAARLGIDVEPVYLEYSPTRLERLSRARVAVSFEALERLADRLAQTEGR